MARYLHNDEAVRAAEEAVRRVLGEDPSIKRAALIDDIFGRIRVLIEVPSEQRSTRLRDLVAERLAAAAGAFWSGDVWVLTKGTGDADRQVYEAAFREGVEEGERFRRVARWRSRGAWVRPVVAGVTGGEGTPAGPPVVAFGSFKGGVGRTTALAAFAIRRARAGERVVVVDLDLDAPGAGRLLAADPEGAVSPWGVVDFLIEHPFGAGPLSDYYHVCGRTAVTGGGAAIEVFPAGSLDEGYLRKLARVDLEVHAGDGRHPFFELLDRIRGELTPDWILVDARAGLSPAAGLLLDGGADLVVLFATASAQSDSGLERMVHRLGAERVHARLVQADCLVVQAMVPDDKRVGEALERQFAERVRELFVEHYLVAAEDDIEDETWSTADLETEESPHHTIPIRYRDAFAAIGSIDGIAEELAASPDFTSLALRIESWAERRSGGNE